MVRDIDYAAVAVRTALTEKYGRHADLAELEVEASENTIAVRQSGRTVEGTRDQLLASIRKSESFDDFWRQFPVGGRSVS